MQDLQLMLYTNVSDLHVCEITGVSLNCTVCLFITEIADFKQIYFKICGKDYIQLFSA